MSKKLNLPFALGFFLIGLSFLPSVAKAQVVNGRTNAYWDVNGTAAGEGGLGSTTSSTWSSSSVFWTTNAENAQAPTGGPFGGGLFSVTTGAPNTAVANTSGGYYFNFTGTPGIVAMGGNMTVSGLNFTTDGYTLTTTSGSRKITGTNAIVGGVTNQAVVSLGNNVNLNLTSFNAAPATASLTLSALNIVGGTGSSITLGTGAASVTNSVFGEAMTIDAAAPIRVNIGTGSKLFFGSQSSSGLTVNANITNSSASGVALNITNSSSGTVALNGVISGNNGLVLDNTSTGTITLAASNTYAGGTIVNGTTGTGSIRLANSSALGTGQLIISDGATSYIRAQGNDLKFTNAVQIGSGATLQLAATNSGHKSTWSGVISGAGGINYNFSDSGLYLTGTDSSFGNGVNISSSGTLYVSKLGMAGANSSIGTNGTITISPSGTTGAGKVRWTGSADEISDKNFALTTVSSSASAGVQILADGATNATLTLNGNINSTGINNKVITLAGYNTNKLILNGTINETATYTNSVIIGASSSGTVVLGNTNNSFSGAVSIVQGTAFQSTVLQTAQIGSNGVNSTLGRNGTINIGSSDKDRVTVLRYVGEGETSDKVINLSGTTGGAILEQAGTGNLKFTSAMTATGVGAKAITLQGSTAGTGELVGAISDLGGNVISLNKYGSGDWTLSGNNSYSGLTTVSGAGSLMKLMATGALSANTSLAGENSLSSAGTIDFGVGGSYTANSYGTVSTAGNNMYFTNSSGNAVTLTFTNANNYVTGSTGGGRTLINSSSNLNLDFDGNIEIGSTATNTTTFRGAGSFNVDGNLLDTGANGVRTLQKDGEGTLTLRGSGNNYRGSTTVETGTLDLYGSVTASTNIVVSTSGTVSTASTTRTATATLDVKSGGSLLANSTTIVYSGGNLIVNGTAGAVVVENNGLLGGEGTVGAVTLNSGSLLNPGNSPGTLTAASSIWKSGSTYNWEIDSNASSAEAGTNWDLFSVTGSGVLDMSALSSAATMNLVLNSLSGFDLTSSTNREWVIAQAGSLLGTGGAVLTAGANVSDYFNINATAFNAGTPSLVTEWRVEVGSTGTTLNLMAVPEPSTGSMLGLGLAGLVVTRLLRRKNS